MRKTPPAAGQLVKKKPQEFNMLRIFASPLHTVRFPWKDCGSEGYVFQKPL
jgi:hypothetical protein